MPLAAPDVRAILGVDLRPLACWYCGFESRRPHGCLSVCCECCVLSDRGISDEPITVQRSPTECGVSECDLETSALRRPRPTRADVP
jgi:hypothetical protein